MTGPPSSLAPVRGSTTSLPDRPDTVVGLLRRLTEDVSKLFRQEVALATAEITRSLTGVVRGAAWLAIAGALLFAGLLVLLAAAVLALALILPSWAAALIVGFGVGAAGFGLLRIGGRKLAGTTIAPKHTAESLRMDKAVITRQTHEPET
ncbi:MAG: phage holin family protein [Gammaproteobacteria bacterium]|jgi:hypothetical protein|nr:phage holin family protein [Gammaproteobacteria bacterium]